jgi:hypothetical protein
MRLEPTIAALDKKAEEYKAAADALRNILKYEDAPSEGAQSAGNTSASSLAISSTATQSAKNPKAKATGNKSQSKANGSGDAGNGGKRTLSAEARAKIAAAIKARHAARKQSAS